MYCNNLGVLNWSDSNGGAEAANENDGGRTTELANG